MGKLNKRINNLELIKELLIDRPLFLFILGKKPTIEIYLNKETKEKSFLRMFQEVLFYVTKRKIYGVRVDNSVFFSYKTPKFNGEYEKGLFLGYPECCVKKYCEEQKKSYPQSYNSAKRYLKQCKEMKIKKDLFNIYVGNKSASCEKYGFIPCSPKCKNALKLIEKYEKAIEKFKNG